MTRRPLLIWTGLALFFCFQFAFAPTVLAKHGQGHGEGKGHDEHEKHHGKSDDKDRGDREKGPKVKHRGMDANGDGVISRDEWRGNDVSFRNQDWNGDGRLTGDELRPGAIRPQQDDQTKLSRMDAEQGLASSLMGKVKEKVISFLNWLF